MYLRGKESMPQNGNVSNSINVTFRTKVFRAGIIKALSFFVLCIYILYFRYCLFYNQYNIFFRFYNQSHKMVFCIKIFILRINKRGRPILHCLNILKITIIYFPKYKFLIFYVNTKKWIIPIFIMSYKESYTLTKLQISNLYSHLKMHRKIMEFW